MRRKYFNTDSITERNLKTRELSMPTEEKELPWVIEAKDDSSLDFLLNFVTQEKSRLQDVLLKHGGILLRGFNVENSQHFESILNKLGINLSKSYALGGQIRSKISNHVFNTTKRSNKNAILGHTEMDYMENRPRFIAFYCAIEPPMHGETPIFNCRAMYRSLNDRTKSVLQNKELQFDRIIYKKPHRSNPKTIKQTFETDNFEEIEAILKANDATYQWREDSLCIKVRQSPFVMCPETHEVCVNVLSTPHRHFFLKEVVHLRNRQSLIYNYCGRLVAFMLGFLQKQKKLVSLQDNQVVNAQYDKTIAKDFFYSKWKHSVVFKWRQKDVLMLDNMLTAHGRMNVIPPREIQVCFGNMYNRKQCAA